MINQIKTDIKILFRIPIVVFFNNIFPIFLASVMIFSLGNIDIGNGFHFSDKYFLIALTLGVAPLTIVSFSISITELFYSGTLTRMYLFGLNVKNIIFSQFIIHILVGLFQFFLTMIFIKLVFNLNLPNFSHFISFLITYIITLVAMLSLGLFIGLILKNRETTQTVSMGIMFVILFLVGGFGTYDTFPDSITFVSKLIPLTYLSQNSFEIYSNETFYIFPHLVCSASYMILFFTLSYRIIKSRLKFF